MEAGTGRAGCGVLGCDLDSRGPGGVGAGRGDAAGRDWTQGRALQALMPRGGAACSQFGATTTTKAQKGKVGWSSSRCPAGATHIGKTLNGLGSLAIFFIFFNLIQGQWFIKVWIVEF